MSHIYNKKCKNLWMTGKDLPKYLFDTWIKNRSNDKIKLEALNKLREKRRLLIDTYFLQ